MKRRIFFTSLRDIWSIKLNSRMLRWKGVLSVSDVEEEKKRLTRTDHLNFRNLCQYYLVRLNGFMVLSIPNNLNCLLWQLFTISLPHNVVSQTCVQVIPKSFFVSFIFQSGERRRRWKSHSLPLFDYEGSKTWFLRQIWEATWTNGELRIFLRISGTAPGPQEEDDVESKCTYQVKRWKNVT